MLGVLFEEESWTVSVYSVSVDECVTTCVGYAVGKVERRNEVDLEFSVGELLDNSDQYRDGAPDGVLDGLSDGARDGN